MWEFITDSTVGSIVPSRGGLDDRAASPIIGVILMVAITVIVASVLAVFVFGFGVEEPGPSVTFEYQYDRGETELMIHHVSGDTFQASDVTILLDGNEATWADIGSLVAPDTTVTVGDGVRIGDGDGSDPKPAVQPTDTVKLRWESADGEQSTILDTWEGPDA